LRRRFLLTFVAISASTTLALNASSAQPTGPEVRQFVRLAAQAAVVPVPRPLPLVTDAAPVELAAAPALAAGKAIAPPPEVFTGAAPVAVAPPPRLQTAPAATAGAVEAGTWAVVIGINDYPGTDHDLNYADNDANDAAQALAQQGVTSERVLNLRDGQVSAGVIKSAVNWLNSHAGPDAVAVFFYAGHVKKQGSSEAIVTSDGSSVADYELASWLRPLAARRAWITIAACYGGGFTEVLAPGRVLTAAAGANDVAYESSAFGRSYLGEYMIRRAMVERAADDTVQSAFAWAHDRLSSEYPEREPVQFDSGDGRLDLRPPGAAPSSAPSAAAAPAPEGTPPADPPAEGGGSEPDPPPHCRGGIIKFC
jgi:hypothetical protein